MKRILVYNNNTGVVGAVQHLFAGEGYEVLAVPTLGLLQEYIAEESAQLLIMDVEPARRMGTVQELHTGLSVVRAVRQKSSLPIIILSANESEKIKVEALNAGADDYVTCPYSPLELLARVKSQIRRYTQLSGAKADVEGIYQVDGLVVDDRRREVRVEGRQVRLTPLEYKILRLLVQKKGIVFSIEQIYEAIWNMEAIGADNTIAVHIRHIREKIEPNPKEPQYLKVVWGSGYRVG